MSEAQHPKHSFFDQNNSEAKAIREACMEVSRIIYLIVLAKVADPHHFNEDPDSDPAFH